jgi:GNAT superfamily N-acetyltransferase
MATLGKSPSRWPEDRVDRFEELVREGGEVTGVGLRARIEKAKLLVCHEDGDVLAIAALKNPVDTYRKKVSTRSGFKLTKRAYPYELGWVYVVPHRQGEGLSRKVVEACLKAAGPKGVFATSDSGNERMHRTLRRCGFKQIGRRYVSDRDDSELVLFVRPAREGED